TDCDYIRTFDGILVRIAKVIGGRLSNRSDPFVPDADITAAIAELRALHPSSADLQKLNRDFIVELTLLRQVRLPSADATGTTQNGNDAFQAAGATVRADVAVVRSRFDGTPSATGPLLPASCGTATPAT